MKECYVEALYAYQAAEKNQISLRPPERIQVLERDESGWWIGRNSQGVVGIFPSTYVKEVKTERVFHKPKEMKQLPVTSPTSSGGRKISKEAKLAFDLGLELEALSDEDSATVTAGGGGGSMTSPANNQQQQQIKNLRAEVVDLKTKCGTLQADKDVAVQKMRDAEADALESRKKAEMARTQLNVLKKSTITQHEKERRLQQEIQDLKAELSSAGKAVPEFKYECTPDEAIERFITNAVGTLKQDLEELQKENAQLKLACADAEKRLAEQPATSASSAITLGSP
eukprot:RCo045265